LKSRVLRLLPYAFKYSGRLVLALQVILAGKYLSPVDFTLFITLVNFQKVVYVIGTGGSHNSVLMGDTSKQGLYIGKSLLLGLFFAIVAFALEIPRGFSTISKPLLVSLILIIAVSPVTRIYSYIDVRNGNNLRSAFLEEGLKGILVCVALLFIRNVHLFSIFLGLSFAFPVAIWVLKGPKPVFNLKEFYGSTKVSILTLIPGASMMLINWLVVYLAPFEYSDLEILGSSVSFTLLTITGMYIASANLYSANFIRTSSDSVYLKWVFTSLVVPAQLMLLGLTLAAPIVLYLFYPSNYEFMLSSFMSFMPIYSLIFIGQVLYARLVYVNKIRIAALLSVVGMAASLAVMFITMGKYPLSIQWGVSLVAWNLIPCLYYFWRAKHRVHRLLIICIVCLGLLNYRIINDSSSWISEKWQLIIKSDSTNILSGAVQFRAS